MSSHFTKKEENWTPVSDRVRPTSDARPFQTLCLALGPAPFSYPLGQSVGSWLDSRRGHRGRRREAAGSKFRTVGSAFAAPTDTALETRLPCPSPPSLPPEVIANAFAPIVAVFRSFLRGPRLLGGRGPLRFCSLQGSVHGARSLSAHRVVSRYTHWDIQKAREPRRPLPLTCRTP